MWPQQVDWRTIDVITGTPTRKQDFSRSKILHISKVSIDSCILSLTGLNLEPFENHFEMKNHICPSDPRRGVDK